jgi:hypothetical protein
LARRSGRQGGKGGSAGSFEKIATRKAGSVHRSQ